MRMDLLDIVQMYCTSVLRCSVVMTDLTNSVVNVAVVTNTVVSHRIPRNIPMRL